MALPPCRGELCSPATPKNVTRSKPSFAIDCNQIKDLGNPQRRVVSKIKDFDDSAKEGGNADFALTGVCADRFFVRVLPEGQFLFPKTQNVPILRKYKKRQPTIVG